MINLKTFYAEAAELGAKTCRINRSGSEWYGYAQYDYWINAQAFAELCRESDDVEHANATTFGTVVVKFK